MESPQESQLLFRAIQDAPELPLPLQMQPEGTESSENTSHCQKRGNGCRETMAESTAEGEEEFSPREHWRSELNSPKGHARSLYPTGDRL